MSFSENLRNRRHNRGWSQEELAKASGISPRSVHGYESGETDPSLEALQAMAKALGCTTGFLLGETDSPLPKPTSYVMHDAQMEGRGTEIEIRETIDDMRQVRRKNPTAWQALKTIVSELAGQKAKPPGSSVKEGRADLGLKGEIAIAGESTPDTTERPEKKRADEPHR